MKKRLLFWALLLALSWSIFPTAAQDNSSPVVMVVDVGYDNYFRVNYWLPIRVQIRNEGAPIQGRISVRPESSGRAVSSASLRKRALACPWLRRSSLTATGRRRRLSWAIKIFPSPPRASSPSIS